MHGVYSKRSKAIMNKKQWASVYCLAASMLLVYVAAMPITPLPTGQWLALTLTSYALLVLAAVLWINNKAS